MLKSFIGTYNERGLQTLRNEDELCQVVVPRADMVPFWATLDSEILPSIEKAIRFGDRRAAFAIIANHALHGGRILR
jgi:hypothetical protein